MTTMVRLSAYPAVHALGWALLHFVWQGTFVGTLLAVILRLLRRRSAQLRYVIACFALMLVVILPALTWRHLLVKGSEELSTANGQFETAHGTAARTGSPSIGSDTGAILLSAGQLLNRSLPSVLFLWCAGVILFSSRLCIGLVSVHRLKSHARQPVSDMLQELFLRGKSRFGIDRVVEISASALVEVPTVAGWFRPIILFPVGCLTGLAPAQIEALLVHELAHVRRHDYLVNVLQSVVETLLFYHPAVWWISAQMREEREHCCDDLASEVSGDRLGYAKALSSLEEYRSATPLGALGANGGKLALRIRRILGFADTRSVAPFTASALLILALMTAVTCSLSFSMQQRSVPTYSHLSVQDMERLQHYGITSSFAEGINAVGIGRASVEQLVRLRQYAVDPQYAAKMKALGLEDLTFEDLVRFRQYDVSPEYAARMNAAGYRKPEQILRLQRQGISVAQAEASQGAGNRSSPQER